MLDVGWRKSLMHVQVTKAITGEFHATSNIPHSTSNISTTYHEQVLHEDVDAHADTTVYF
jgi:hypothetical protein